MRSGRSIGAVCLAAGVTAGPIGRACAAENALVGRAVLPASWGFRSWRTGSSIPEHRRRFRWRRRFGATAC